MKCTAALVLGLLWHSVQGIDLRGVIRGKKCDLMCPARYDPVCGTDGHTYSSACVLYVTSACTGSTVTVEYRGECHLKMRRRRNVPLNLKGEHVLKQVKISKKCNWVCPAVYDPICGTDEKTYSNGCVLRIERKCHGSTVVIKHRGACGMDMRRVKRQASISSCLVPCSPQYNPVCASSGITYPNRCQFEIARCLGAKSRISYNGQCRS